MMKTKVCNGPICKQEGGVEKPVSEFNKDKIRKDGLSPYCRGCNAYYHRERYKTAEGEKVKKEYNKKFNETEAGKKTARQNYLNQLAKFPARRKARAFVNNSIYRGKLPKASTVQCNYPKCNKQAQEYHHHSYERKHWLDITPYCREHHREIDNAQKL